MANVKNISVNQKNMKEKEKTHDKKYLSIDNNLKLNHIKFSKSFPEMNRDANQLNIEALFKRGCF